MDEACDEVTGPVFDEVSRLNWPASESIDRCWKYMLDRVCDVDLLVKHTRTRGVVVQAGGFVGMWALRLARTFERVYTFEPIPEVYTALVLNTHRAPNIITENCALSAGRTHLPLGYHRSGCSRVESGALMRPARTIDSMKLIRCDAIYLDVEKHELEALAGAEETIERFHPAIMLETHPDQMQAQNAWMVQHGYKLQAKVHGDRVFTWGKH